MISGSMTATEFFDDITKKFPRWWRPHDVWRQDVLKTLSRFHDRQIAQAHAEVVRAETRPSLEELEELLASKSSALFPAEKKAPLDDVIAKWLATNDLAEAYAKASHHVRYAIQRLIDIVRYDDGWSVRLGMHAGLSTHWKPWERIEHLHNVAMKASINGTRILTPGFRPPVGDYTVKLPPPPAWFPPEVIAERKAKRSKIIARHGGMLAGAKIVDDPEWQQMNEELAELEAKARLEHYGDTFA